MIRIVFYLAVIALGAFLAGWFIDREGRVEIVWLEHHVSTSVAVLVGAILAAGALLIFVGWITVVALNSPARVAQKAKARRARRAHHAMTQGLIAVGAGDVASAARFAGEARKLAANEPLTLLLSAQSAQLSGDRAAAEKIFTAMTARPETKLLGLHGLFVEARRGNDLAAARALAEQAIRTRHRHIGQAAPCWSFAAQVRTGSVRLRRSMAITGVGCSIAPPTAVSAPCCLQRGHVRWSIRTAMGQNRRRLRQ